MHIGLFMPLDVRATVTVIGLAVNLIGNLYNAGAGYKVYMGSTNVNTAA